MSNEIKVEGEFNTYGDAIRYIKDKGRFDLIPEQVVCEIFENIISKQSTEFILELLSADKQIDVLRIESSAFNGYYVDAIIMLAYFDYARKGLTISGKTGAETMTPIFTMLMELAKHFQRGAEKYGARNCEKGIPLWSFRDSGLRHLQQYLLGKTDENHFCAAIWNFMMARWTIRNYPERCKPDDVDNHSPKNKKEETTKVDMTETLNIRINPEHNSSGVYSMDKIFYKKPTCVFPDNI